MTEDLIGTNVVNNEMVVPADVWDQAVEESKKAFLPKVADGSEHILRVESVVQTLTKESKKPMFAWVFRVCDGDVFTGLNTEIKHWTQFNSFLVGFLRALGISKELTPEVFQPDGLHLSTELMVNRMIRAQIVWRKTLKPDSEGKEVLTDEDYWINLDIKRSYPIDPPGKKWSGESVTVTNNSSDPAPFM